MDQAISTLFLIPLILWSVFQPMLNMNTGQTQETIKIALYEIQKEASLNGQYSESLYSEFKEQLVENHGYKPECIEIVGTETLTTRGEELKVEVKIPKPIQSVYDLLDVGSCDRPDSYTPYTIVQTIQSEYIP